MGVEWGVGKFVGSGGESVGSVGAAPASFCVCAGKAAPALGRYCDALQWGGRHLPAWCWCVGVKWGVGKFVGSGGESMGSVGAPPVR